MNAPWLVKIAAAATIPALIGMGAAFSAPSARDAVVVPPAKEDTVSLDTFKPGDHGIDYALVTGPRADRSKAPACADPERRGDLRPCL
ncbi:hypothetical protein [Aminobacter sp. J44]|uniref:hypothetical protein n=1 Tax=Aminobacter sp. J44 TaxID=935262 RepID=UPI00119AB82A|nr:hypothetical protein [Aminobacter sp. J44]TWG50011.1 hypothetical protein L610_000600000150 [Aminobacter sp. J44]